MQLTLPSSFYRDPQAWARDRTDIFAAGWQFLGHESEVARAGDVLAGVYVVRSFETVGVRI